MRYLYLTLRNFSLLLFLCFTSNGWSTIWRVGPGHDYTTPNALYTADQSGDIDIADYDTIYIDPGEYVGPDALAAWQQNNLYIAGTGGIGDRPHLIADGAYILGKGIWVCVGNNIRVSSIEFSGATVPDENGAGIRLDGIGLTLDSCYFHDNENGLLTSNPYDGNILIEFCEFAHNGFGDGYTHNMYIGHVNSFILRHSYTHHTEVGHNVKSRANTNYILYNRIHDEETGFSSRLIDLPNGGYALIKGNGLMQGPAAINNNLVGYGLEGLSNPEPHEIYVVHNTFVNERVGTSNFVHVEEGTTTTHIVNNIFAGNGNVLVGEPTTLSHNYANDNISHFEFQDPINYIYHIGSSSPVRDSGMVLTGDLIPTEHYTHAFQSASRDMVGDRPDIGAFEYVFPIGIAENDKIEFALYPNPSNGLLNVVSERKINRIEIFNALGQPVFNTTSGQNLIEFNAPPGLYVVQVSTEKGTGWQQLIVE